MPTFSTYEYAYVRVVPRVERGEFLNVGIILFCRTRRFLVTRIKFDVQRLHALAPTLDITVVQDQLALLPLICAGKGPIGQLGQAEAFHWLVAPHSTVIQTSPVHAGMCEDPALILEHLVETL